MSILSQIAASKPLVIPLAAWFIAQASKISPKNTT